MCRLWVDSSSKPRGDKSDWRSILWAAYVGTNECIHARYVPLKPPDLVQCGKTELLLQFPFLSSCTQPRHTNQALGARITCLLANRPP
jgi:hypothetical protein